MKIDKWENKALKILNKVEEDCESICIFCLLHFGIGANFGCLQAHFFVAYSNYKLLFANFIRLRPFSIFTIENAAFKHYSPHFIDYCLRDKSFV